jgi:PAS domain S-box-containing protein
MTWNWKTLSLWQRCLAAVLIIALASAVRAIFFGGLGRGIPYLTYYPAVMFAALYGGLPAGFLATAMSAVLCFFWIQRGFMSPVESLAMAIFVLSCIIIACICEAMRHLRFRPERHAADLQRANEPLQRELAARQQAEAAERESELRYRSLFENMLEGFAYCQMLYDQQERPVDFVYLDVNKAFGQLTGLENVVGKPVSEVIPGIKESSPELFELYGRVAATGKPEKFEFYLQPLSLWLDISVFSPRKGFFVAAFENITARKQAEAFGEMGREVLQILNEAEDFQQSIQRVFAVLKTRTGFDAVGIRLQDGDDFPYFVQQGFPMGFLLTENTLIERAADGGMCRDKDGNVCLECTCGLVISGKTDPANPLFTRGGSAWTNDSFPLLNIPSGQDPRLHPRNRCIHLGYASVALVPIRNKHRIVGLIQFNDRRKGRFTLNSVELLEGIASHIGAALMRKQVEEALRRSETKYRTLYDSTSDAVMLLDQKGFLDCNQATLAIFGCATREEFCSRHPADMSPPIQPDGTDSPTLANRYIATAMEQGSYHFEWMHRRADTGEAFPADVLLNLLRLDGKPVLQAVVRDITERKRAEEDLRQSEEKFRNLFNNSQIGMFRTRFDGSEILEFNAKYLRILNCTHEDVKGAPSMNFWADQRERDQLVQLLKAEGQVTDYECSILNKQGEVKRCLTSLRLYRDTGILEGSIQDITERKRAEDSLRDSEEQFRGTFSLAAVGIAHVGLDGRWLRVNQRLCDIVGYSWEELRHMTFQDMTHPDTLGTDVASLHQMLAGKLQTYKVEKRYLRKDRSSVPVNLTVSLVRAVSGEPKYFISVIEDITERKRAEEKLRQLSRAVEQNPAAIVITNAAGDIEYVNPKFIEITGYTLAEALGKNPRILKSGEKSPEAYRELWQTITVGQDWHGEFHNKKKNGELYWENASIAPIRDDAGVITHYVAVKEDINARKQLEAERQQLIQKLQNALANVKSLSGLLPICAGCKKIRDDKGYWSQVESYIQEHSEATFTHGLCPECLKKLYPELGEPQDRQSLKTP